MSRDEAIQISGVLEPKDYVKASIWLGLRRRLWLHAAYIAVVVFGTAVLVVGYEFGSGPRPPSPGEILLPVLILLALPVFLVAVQLVAIQFAARRQFSSTPGVTLPTRYDFDEEGLAVENANVSTRQRWESLLEARESSECFVLLRSRAQGLIVPKRMFRNDAQLADFRGLVRRRLGEKAKLRPPV